MKIALVTIHNANNYGAVLQTFAMQEVLKRYGEVEVINYKNRHISRSFDLVRIKLSFHGLLGVGKDVFRLFPRRRVIKKFKAFIGDKLCLTESLTHEDLVNGKASGYDVYVAGSDQIWNPMCVNEKGLIDLGYFLDFAPAKAKKISFASSIGGHKYSDAEAAHVQVLLSSFEHLAVREKGTQIYLEKLLNKPVEHVLDPTLLLNKRAWLEAIEVSSCKSGAGYILLYTVPKLPLIRGVVSFFANKLGLKVVLLEQGLTASARVDEHIRDAGPKDFIELFANASFVITDSFHGTCFALNFEKPFVTVSSGRHSNRIESLLNLVGLEDRLLKDLKSMANIPLEMDMSAALERLNIAREESLSYLASAVRS
ncbi:polysaccharide pyruvyl transferase family protein [Stutzerimonas frequens]|uniref:polysaccharide pyruvyl transferase family protein n=1 Tax=Stutzerimonas frequens TaxID=2968969 RepID=UPI001AAF0E20|nr:polysaccharide pyruvyl transferase family protein [Stutzerimonas frequens]QTF55349.1 polysaccharide pyruvyl transferase family protein [Stutzerimonas frequens]